MKKSYGQLRNPKGQYQSKLRRKMMIEMFAVLCLIAFAAPTYVAIQIERDQFQVAEVHAQTVKEIPMKEWVLKTVEEAGIDPYEAYVIISCESRWNPENRGIVIQKNGVKSVDRGLWQLNDFHQKQISNSCAYDYKCATTEAIKIYKSWGSWGAWVCSKQLK